MSQESIEIVRSALEAISRGDVDAAFKHMAPDAEYDQTRALGMNPGVFPLERWRRFVEEFTGSWESVRYEADDFIAAGEHVVTPFTNHLRGRDGIELQARGIWLWTLRDGAIVRCCLYQELEEALEAVGLAKY